MVVKFQLVPVMADIVSVREAGIISLALMAQSSGDSMSFGLQGKGLLKSIASTALGAGYLYRYRTVSLSSLRSPRGLALNLLDQCIGPWWKIRKIYRYLERCSPLLALALSVSQQFGH